MAGKTVMANGKAVRPRINPALIDSPAAFAPDADTPKLTMRQLKEMARPVDHAPVDVASLRKRLGMSQGAFARTFGLSVGAVRDWEQGRCSPDRPAQTLLRVIDRNPKAVEQALAA
jgi:putative transcriptional regulator